MRDARPRILLLFSSSTYRLPDVLRAGRGLGVDCVVGTDFEPVLARFRPAYHLHLDFERPGWSLERIAEHAARYGLSSVLGVDDSTLELAARAARIIAPESEGDLLNDPRSIEIARDKSLFRAHLNGAGIGRIWSRKLELGVDAVAHQRLASAAETARYPCVLKPFRGSASQGVIRVDNRFEFVAAGYRIDQILTRQRISTRILVEEFVPGPEIAVEGFLRAGRLALIAIFDKPDPLDGPFFAEEIYVKPSRLGFESRAAVVEIIERAAEAIGLRFGPVHAELRLGPSKPWLIELAPRSIGGLCARAVRLPGGRSLDEFVISQILLGNAERECSDRLEDRTASGVLMLTAPMPGYVRSIDGLDAARAISGISDIQLALRPGEWFEPVPEGDRYAGFVFASGTCAAEVEASLRLARDTISIRTA